MFNILEPKECSVSGFTMQVAEYTRTALSNLIASASVLDKAIENTADMDKATEKKLREEGKEAFVVAHASLPEGAVINVLEEAFRHDLLVRLQAEDKEKLLPVVRLYLAINRAAEASKNCNHLRIQGIVSAAKAAAYTLGVKVDSEESKGLVWLLASAPRGTSGHLDSAMSACSAFPGIHSRVQEYMEYLFESDCPLSEYTPRYRPSHGGFNKKAFGIVKTVGETPMFHGFLSADDFYSLRFTSTRVGAAVKQWGGSDEDARRATALCNTNAAYTYKLYPNDYPFGEVYIDFDNHTGMRSCMSGDDFDDVPHGVHPADAYSAAHFGVEDNGLVLVVALREDSVVGRGILNINNKQVVRWYGKHKAWVQLSNLLGIEVDSDALSEGTWLALLEEDGKFAHPYVDGTEYGSIEGDKVLLGFGSIVVQNTVGYGYSKDIQKCVYDDESYPETEMTYQEHSETWILTHNIRYATQCAISGEYFDSYNTHTRTVNGADMPVYAGVRADNFDYHDIGYNIGWTQDPEQYVFDDVTEKYYTEDKYEELLAEREEIASDEDSNANAA